MRINIRHATTYHYESAAESALQLLRLTPRSHEGQFVRRWRVAVDADARLESSEDAFGNITHMVFLSGPLEQAEILIEGEVETTDTNGVVRGAVERQPHRLYLRETALTRPTPEIRKLARDMAASQGGNTLAILHGLTAHLHEEMAFEVGATSASTNAGEAFKAKTGVCQDFAHIFIAAARCLGVPARYVSGYFLRTDMVQQEAGHAWVEAHADGIGWIGFDPTHGLSPSDRYVRLAIGCDAQEAAPVRGSRIGGEKETLAVSLQIAQGQRMLQE